VRKAKVLAQQRERAKKVSKAERRALRKANRRQGPSAMRRKEARAPLQEAWKRAHQEPAAEEKEQV
jgi:hypothetical protein